MPQALKKRTVDVQRKPAVAQGKNQGKKPANGQVGNDSTSLALQREQRARRARYVIIGLVAVIVLAIIGVLYYKAYVEPYQRVIITVDSTQIRMDYFLERTKLAGADPIQMTQGLTNEILIRQGAAQNGIKVTPQDIDAVLRQTATGDKDQISDAEYKEWYRQQLAQAKVSEARFREIVETQLLTARLQDYLGEKTSTVVPQIHVSIITVPTEDEAKKVVERSKAGEDFASLARELSEDTTTRDKGGDLGWMPEGVSVFDATAFGLEVGKVSDPIPYVVDNGAQDPSQGGSQANSQPAFWYVLLVTEKSDARQADDQYIPALKSQALTKWLSAEMPKHKISWNLDSNMYAWIKYQIGKSQPASNQSPDQSPGGQRNGGQSSGGQQ